MRWFTADACYVFHPMNAWEEGTRFSPTSWNIRSRRCSPTPMERRPGRGAAGALDLRSRRRLRHDQARAARRHGREFPRFDERYAGLATGTAGSRPNAGEAPAFDALAHIDLKTGRRKIYRFPAGDAPGEPIFVPRDAHAPEGDGWLVAVVYRGAEDRSDFLVFDARDRVRADRDGQAAAPRPLRLPRQLAAALGFRRRLRLAVR